MKFDTETFSSAFVNLAVKGHLRIDESKKGAYAFHGLKQASPLAPGERAILDNLFNGRSDTSIERVQSNHPRIGKAIAAHRKALATHYEKIDFLTNSGYLLPGLRITIGVITAMIQMLPGGEMKATSGFFLVWLCIWTTGLFFLMALHQTQVN